MPLLYTTRRTLDAGCRPVPPLLAQQKSLMDRVERPTVPAWRGKALVLRQRFDATRTVRVGTCFPAIFKIAGQLARNQSGKRKLLVRRKENVLEPVDIGL